MTYYELLEVREDASPEVIKMAYKGLIRKSHPDVYNGEKEGSNNKTKSLNEAYAVLSDSMAREQYDMYLKELREDIKYTKDREKVSKEERKNKSRVFSYTRFCLEV